MSFEELIKLIIHESFPKLDDLPPNVPRDPDSLISWACMSFSQSIIRKLITEKTFTTSAAPQVTYVVPFQPTEQQWGGLARDIIMWLNMSGASYGCDLYIHLSRLGIKAPEWLRDDIPNEEKVPPKGSIAAAIYKAMLEGSVQWNGRPGHGPR